jgi:hypothetical protein
VGRPLGRPFRVRAVWRFESMKFDDRFIAKVAKSTLCGHCLSQNSRNL